MIAVIFELEPKSNKKDIYFKLAENLKPLLETIDGFISIERFQSVSDPARYLSLSFWEDENAVKEWRNKAEHRNTQQLGRDSIFIHYRLLVVDVIRNYSKTDRKQAPADSCALFG